VCHFILTASIAVLSLIFWPVSDSSGAIDNPALVFSTPVVVANSDESPTVPLPLDTNDWLWNLMMDHFTVPLGPGDQNIWPLWMWRQQWFIAYRHGHGEGSLVAQTRPLCSILRPAGT
jgi:hypothetical protein